MPRLWASLTAPTSGWWSDMPVRGLEQTRRNLKRLTDRISGSMTEKALTEVLIIGEGYAASLTPMDTGNLLQSMYREIKPVGKGFRARLEIGRASCRERV